MDADKKQRKKKRKSTEVVQKSPTKMEVDNDESLSENEEEEETIKKDVKRVKLDAEISLLDRLHGSDPLSAFKDLDQLIQADQTVCKSFNLIVKS